MSSPTQSLQKSTYVEPPMVSGRLPLLGHAIEFMRDPHKLIRRGYEEHGMIFTLDMGAKRAVFMLGPHYHQFFFKETDGVFSMRQGYETLLKMFDSKLFTFAHQTEAQEQMKVILPLLKNNNRFVDLMVEEVDHFMENTLGEQGEIDLTDAFGPVVMHIGARAFFGDDFREKLGAEYFYMFRDFSEGADVVLPSWLPLPKFKRCREAKARIEQMIYDFMLERRANPMEPKDLFQELIESTYYDNQPVPEDLLVSILLFIPWAAHETTVGAASWTLIDILRNPDYQQQIEEEMRQVLTGENSYAAENLKQLKTLDWATLESERKHPVAHVIMRGVRDDMEFEGYKVKKGSMVFVAPETAHNIPEVFSNPEAYDPRRFSPERGEGSKKFSLIGFGSWGSLAGSTDTTMGAALALNGGFIYLAILAVWYIKLEFIVGICTVLFMVLPLYVTTNLLHAYEIQNAANGLGHYAGWVGLAMYFFSFTQSASHGMEDVPPPYNGRGRFVPQEEVPMKRKITLMFLYPFLSFHEFIASPKLLPYQMLRGLQKFGYRKDLEAVVKEKAQKVLATGIYDPANTWQHDPYHAQSPWADTPQSK